ncbi:MAG: hypothetical protein IPK16_26095 [Anaerolineales bacterium]|nr:hypothetical protein [Anaerolineales bacterium]
MTTPGMTCAGAGMILTSRWSMDVTAVIYAGAGSHASYFIKGEYLTGVSPSFLRPVANAVTWLQQFWYEELKQGKASLTKKPFGIFQRRLRRLCVVTASQSVPAQRTPGRQS